MGMKFKRAEEENGKMTKEELIQAAYEITGGDLKTLSLERLRRLMTITQFVTDLCLNEIEHRRELTFFEGSVIVPYMSEYMVETILTRNAGA
jgi:hypothetical protein